MDEKHWDRVQFADISLVDYRNHVAPNRSLRYVDGAVDSPIVESAR